MPGPAAKGAGWKDPSLRVHEVRNGAEPECETAEPDAAMCGCSGYAW